MACGTPVVCTRGASLPEVVRDAGVLVGPRDALGLADAIRQVLQDHGWASELRRRGLKRARPFSWEKTARKTRGVDEQFP